MIITFRGSILQRTSNQRVPVIFSDYRILIIFVLCPLYLFEEKKIIFFISCFFDSRFLFLKDKNRMMGI